MISSAPASPSMAATRRPRLPIPCRPWRCSKAPSCKPAPSMPAKPWAMAPPGRPRRETRIAVLGAGYKDGVPRALSSGNTNTPPQIFIGGRRCPIIGRVSMDMMAIDVTDLPRAVCPRRPRRNPRPQYSDR